MLLKEGRGASPQQINMKQKNSYRLLLLPLLLLLFSVNMQAQCDYTDGFNQKAATTEYGSTEEILDGWTFYCCRHLANKVVVYIGNGMDENVGYIKTPVYSGGCDAISFSIRMLYSTSGCLKIDIVQNGEVVWSDNISDIPTSAAGYTDYSANGLNIKGDFQVVFTANGSWTLENPCGGMVYANASESPIMIKNICIKKIPIIPPHNFQFNVPKDATVYVGDKDQTVTVAGNYLTKHYVPFTKQEEVYILETDTSNIWYYNLPAPKNASGGFSYRISSNGNATHVGLFKHKAGTAVEKDSLLAFTNEQLQAYSSKAIDHDEAHLDGRNVADVFININAQGYLTLPLGVDTTFQLIHTRNWQAINTDVDNYFIEPDFHYTILDENGQPSTGVVTISETGVITPVGAGTAIVLIDYDAMITHHTVNLRLSADSLATHGALFSKLWPENTAVFVVSVEQPEANITTNMNLNAFWAQDGTDKTDGVAIDAEHDIMYFEASQGSFPYTFTPEGAAEVLVATPIVGALMTSYSGFAADSVVVNNDGSYTVKLGFGRNIIKLIDADGAATYQIITAKPVTYTISNLTHPGEELSPGDEVSILFNRLYHPANKMSGIYNMSAGIQYSNDDINFPLILGPGQYTFASRAQEFKAIIPEDITKGIFVLEKGVIKTKGFGSSYGAHRKISIQNGVNPNLNASVREAFFGAIPDIHILLKDTEAPTAPSNLEGLTTKTSIALSWSESTDNLEVAGYNIYVDGEFVATVNELVYVINQLTPGTEYFVEVEAFDVYGNKSEKGSKTITTDITSVSSINGVPTRTTIALIWDVDIANGVAGYNVYVDGDLVKTLTETSYTLTELKPNTTYFIEVEAFDDDNSVSEKSSVSIQTVAMPTITNVMGIASQTTIGMVWSITTNNGITGYNVYVNGEFATSVSEASYKLTDLTPNTEYVIEIEAYDVYGNTSEKESVSVTTDALTSIHTVQHDAIHAYPNPFVDYIILTTNEAATATITNIAGKVLVHAQLTAGTNRIDTSALPRGVYMVRIGEKVVAIVK